MSLYLGARLDHSQSIYKIQIILDTIYICICMHGPFGSNIILGRQVINVLLCFVHHECKDNVYPDYHWRALLLLTQSLTIRHDDVQYVPHQSSFSYLCYILCGDGNDEFMIM
eukprot:1107461_1